MGLFVSIYASQDIKGVLIDIIFFFNSRKRRYSLVTLELAKKTIFQATKQSIKKELSNFSSVYFCPSFGCVVFIFCRDLFYNFYILCLVLSFTCVFGSNCEVQQPKCRSSIPK